jgi:hypothetical protein
LPTRKKIDNTRNHLISSGKPYPAQNHNEIRWAKEKSKTQRRGKTPRMASDCPPHYETQYPFAAKTKHSEDSKYIKN